MDFILAPQLEADSLFVGELGLSQLRVHKCADFPWVILIPQFPGLSEIIDLTPENQIRLMEEISWVSQTLQRLYKPDKLNVANLGNVVPQLHIHIIARYKSDPVWPSPVWGKPLSPITSESLQCIEQWRRKLQKEIQFGKK